MVGLGTVINTAAIVAGGVLGKLFGRFLSESAQESLTRVCGVSTLFIAIAGALEGMMKVRGGFPGQRTVPADYLLPGPGGADRGNTRHRGRISAVR